MTSDKSWNYAFILHGIAFSMLPTLIPLYFVDSLQGTLVEFGVMSAVATFSSIVTSVYAGQLPERYGRTKPFIAVSFLLSSGCLFALTQTRNVSLFQILYVLVGVANSIYAPSARTLIAETSERAEWSRMFAWYCLIVGLANSTGLAICSLFVSSIGYRTLLALCAPLTFGSFLLALVLINDPPLYVERWLSRISRPIDDLESFSYWFGMKEHPDRFGLKPTVNMSYFGLGTLTFIMAVASARSSLPIFLSGVGGLAPSLVFAIFCVRSIVGSFSYLVVGRLIGEGDGGYAVQFAAIARAVLVLLMPTIAFFPPLTPLLAVLLLTATTVSWSFYSVGNSTVITECAAEGSAGVYDALGSLGNVVGGLLCGLIPDLFNFTILFITASVLHMLAFFIFRKSISAQPQ